MPLSCFTYFHSKKFGSFHCKVTSSKQTKPWSINVFLCTATIKVKDLKFYCDSEFSFVRINKSTITWNWKVKVLRDNVTNNEAICNLLVMELIHSYKQDFLEVGKKKKFLTSRTDWKFCVFGHVMWWIHPQPSLSLSLSS